jgi:hypothetical protein
MASWGPPVQNSGKEKGDRILYLDDEVVPGAFYLETDWHWPEKDSEPVRKYPRTVVTAHTHDFDEVLCFLGTNSNDPHDLCGKVEFITKSAIFFIPQGLQHGPLVYVRVEKPIFSFSLGPGKMYL